MAITPKKKIQNPLSSPGGGVKGGSMGTGGRAGKVVKIAPKPKVSLKPEPSSMRLVPSKRSLFGPEEAAAGNRRILDARNRINTASPKVEKRALKAANKPTIKSKTADAARAQAFKRAENAVAKRNALLKAGKPAKPLTAEQKFAYRRSMDYGPEGVMTKQAAKSIKQQKSIDKLYKSGYLK